MRQNPYRYAWMITKDEEKIPWVDEWDEKVFVRTVGFIIEVSFMELVTVPPEISHGLNLNKLTHFFSSNINSDFLFCFTCSPFPMF